MTLVTGRFRGRALLTWLKHRRYWSWTENPPGPSVLRITEEGEDRITEDGELRSTEGV